MVFTVAAVVLLLLHVPPVPVVDSAMVAAGQTAVGPEMVPVAGAGDTVTSMVSEAVPHEAVTEV